MLDILSFFLGGYAFFKSANISIISSYFIRIKIDNKIYGLLPFPQLIGFRALRNIQKNY